ncbi:MAG TPA: type II toxin-antitoxin system RelE/ParE family toxin [Rhizomicrobium sp.]|jgi:toxin ParE1/3/4|nr:type II toxin-antitoxin system RelE/ParE family toxin [Rhizomicrobium sp.]
MRVVITEDAEADFEDIFDCIAVDSPLAAVQYARTLREKALGPGHFPRRNRVREDLPGEMRTASSGSHLIVYRIAGRRVEILRVIHGARGLPKLFERRPCPTPATASPPTCAASVLRAATS